MENKVPGTGDEPPVPVQVVFTYNETYSKWDVHVRGATSKLEARQAFSAVVITCQRLNHNLLIHALVDNDHRVIPAV